MDEKFDYKVVPIKPGAYDQAERLMNELNHQHGYRPTMASTAQGYSVIIMERPHREEVTSTVIDDGVDFGLPLEDEVPVEVVQAAREKKRSRR